MTGLEAGLTIVGVVSTGIAVYVGLKFDPLKEQVKQDRDDNAKALKEQSELYDKRLDALHVDKKELEKRMNELEKVALTRAELDGLSRSIESMGNRVMEHFDRTAERLERRIEKVEASHG